MKTKITKIEKRVDKFNSLNWYYLIYFDWFSNQKATILNQKALQYWIKKRKLKKLEVGQIIEVVQIGNNKFQIKDIENG